MHVATGRSHLKILKSNGDVQTILCKITPSKYEITCFQTSFSSFALKLFFFFSFKDAMNQLILRI